MQYEYDAVSPNGRTQSGVLSAESASDAIRQLEQQNLIIRSLRILEPQPFAPEVEPTAQPVDDETKFYARLTEQVSEMASLLPALRAWKAESRSRDEQAYLQNLIQIAEQKEPVQSWLNNPKDLNWISVVANPSTDDAMQRIIARLNSARRENEQRTGFRKSLSYPLVVTLIAALLLVFMSLTIVPTFDRMFAEFGLTLPGPTALLVTFSRLLRFYPWIPIGMMILLIAGIILWMRLAITTRLFGLLVAGNEGSLLAMSRFGDALAGLLQLDAPVPLALRLSGQACEHAYFRDAAESFAAEIIHNGGNVHATTVSHNFPPNFLIALDGSLSRDQSAALLREQSTVYRDRVLNHSNWAASLAGILMLMVCGLTVGFTVISLFMPLVQMITSLS